MIYIKEYEDGSFIAYHKYLPLIGRGYDPREAVESLAACIAAYVDAYEWHDGAVVEERPDRWVARSEDYGFTVYAKTFSELKYNYLFAEGVMEFRNSPKRQELWRSIVNDEV